MTNFKFDYFRTRDIVVDLLDALKIEQLFIFIDEWSELDRSAVRNIQPFFAELLKKVFWNNQRFVVKIGAVRNQTKLITKIKRSGPIGLEPGADIFEINLDEAYASWPAPGSEDTKLGVLMEREVRHGATEVYAGVQA